MQSAIRCPYFQKALGWSVPIGALAGLVGLGGGEFRLPVLMYVVGYPARTAVPLNVAVSLVTLTFALVVRSVAVSLSAVVPYLNEIVGLAIGGVASAFCGARFVSAIKNEHLVKTIAALLAARADCRRCEGCRLKALGTRPVVRMSAFGTKQTFCGPVPMTAFGGKADIASRSLDVLIDPKRTFTEHAP